MRALGRDATFVGVDIGTQSLRVGLFTLHGERLAISEIGYPLIRGEHGHVEQDPNHWWDALVGALRRLRQDHPADIAAVRGLSCAATSCTVVACDANAKPLRPALLWMDERARIEARRFSAVESPHLRYSGSLMSPQWMLPKALWLAENEPEIYRESVVIAECVDWMTFRLSGEWVASMDVAASKWNYVTDLGGYPDDLLAIVGPVDLQSRWPQQIAMVGTPIGPVRPDVADELGLPTDVIIAVGGIDAHAGAIAMGALADGVLACTFGTSNCFIANTPQARFNQIWGPFPNALRNGTYTLVGGQTSAGATLDWIGNLLGFSNHDSAAKVSSLASGLEPASQGIVFLDFLQGNRMPYMDPYASGAIWGLRHHHSSAHIARAVVDGLAVGTRLVVEEMCRGYDAFEKVRATGGLTRSLPYMQAVATSLNQSIEVLVETALAARGAAVWAGMGAGLLDDVQFCEAGSAGAIIIEPGPERDRYDVLLNQYEATYQALRPLMRANGHEEVKTE